jgi:regulator of RNase E activity RraA
MTIRFRVARRARSVTASQVAAFRRLPVANVSDCMLRLAAGSARLRPVHASGGMAGPALTVRTRPGDNLMAHRALDMAVPGEINVAVAFNGMVVQLGDLVTGDEDGFLRVPFDQVDAVRETAVAKQAAKAV